MADAVRLGREPDNASAKADRTAIFRAGAPKNLADSIENVNYCGVPHYDMAGTTKTIWKLLQIYGAR
ncbi:MAG TPA: hypothetical protein VFC46_02860, partial [Humisphaera sp.]|nr:hypothetical protein [Humisphaera sp.]